MKVFIKTYGCQANIADSEAMAGLLQKQGHDIVDNEKDAEKIIINSCSVKNKTQAKEMHYARKWSEEKEVFVGGCLTKTIDVKKFAPNVIAVFDTNSLTKVAEVLEKKKDIFSETKELSRLDIPVMRVKKTIGIIPISQGCLNTCTYCATKHSRGNLVSYRIGDIKRAVEQAVKDGCTKIYLTSQDTGCYGFDMQTTLPELLQELIDIEGDFIIRVGMMNPWHLKKILPELLSVYHSEKIMKFLHIPLQSGSDTMLKHMKRIHTIQEFRTIVHSFRKEFPQGHIATDIIVGYPLETQEDFKQTCSIIQEFHPEVLNISKFSSRKNTAAATLKQLSSEIIDERSKELNRIYNEIKKEFLTVTLH